VIGYVDEQGRYHRGEAKKLGQERNTMYQQWSHDQQRKEYAKEIIQPHVNGKPNPDFVRAYPEYSHQYWDQDQIDKALREQA